MAEKEKVESGPVVVFASALPIEAEQVCCLLEGRGFTARVLDRNFVGMKPWLSVWAGGVKVVVPAEQAEEARAVMRDAGFDGGDPGTWPRAA
jgi:hypothetical protein